MVVQNNPKRPKFWQKSLEILVINGIYIQNCKEDTHNLCFIVFRIIVFFGKFLGVPLGMYIEWNIPLSILNSSAPQNFGRIHISSTL